MKLYKGLNVGVLVFFLGVGMMLATEYVAYQYNFKVALGKPWGHFIIPIYSPFKVIEWFVKYYSNSPQVFINAAHIVMASILTGLLPVGVLSIVGIRHNKTTNTHGSARWATRHDLQKLDLQQQSGVVLGEFKGMGALTHNGPEHILLNAPTRSGKGVGVIIPTLLSWPASVLVLDIKRENWHVSSGFRAKFSHVLCFDPTAMDTACWNPLFEVRKGEKEVKDVQNIVDILIDPDGSNKPRDHWAKTAHSLLVASILHVLYAEANKSLAGVANFLANPERPIYKTLQYMQQTLHLKHSSHSVVASIAQEMLNKSEAELSGVVSTAMSFLSLYRDPSISNATSKSDFSINSLMNSNYPVSLYLAVPAGDIDRLMPLNRLFINLACRRLTEVAVVGRELPHKHRMLMLLDEFPALGCMPFFKKSLGFLAGYGIKLMLVCQSFNNIYEHYGNKNSIFDNCHIRLTMAPNDNATAREIAESLGQATVKRHQVNFTGRRLAPFLANISVADQETGRNLLNADEVQKLAKDKIILMVAGSYPAMLTKILYYQDEPFKGRVITAAATDKVESIVGNNSTWTDVIVPVVALEPAVLDADKDIAADIKNLSADIEKDASIDMQACSNKEVQRCILGIGE